MLHQRQARHQNVGGNQPIMMMNNNINNQSNISSNNNNNSELNVDTLNKVNHLQQFRVSIALNKLQMNVIVPDCFIAIILKVGDQKAESKTLPPLIDRLACFNKEIVSLVAEFPRNLTTQEYLPTIASLTINICHEKSVKRAGRIEIDLAVYANSNVFSSKEQRNLLSCPEPTAKLFYEIQLEIIESQIKKPLQPLPLMEPQTTFKNMNSGTYSVSKLLKPVTAKLQLDTPPESRNNGSNNNGLVNNTNNERKISNEGISELSSKSNNTMKVMDDQYDTTITAGNTQSSGIQIRSNTIVEQKRVPFMIRGSIDYREKQNNNSSNEITVSGGGVQEGKNSNQTSPTRQSLEMNQLRTLFKSQKEENLMLQVKVAQQNEEISKLRIGSEFLRTEGLKMKELVSSLERMIDISQSSQSTAAAVSAVGWDEQNLTLKNEVSQLRQALNAAHEEIRQKRKKFDDDIERQRTENELIVKELRKCISKSENELNEKNLEIADGGKTRKELEIGLKKSVESLSNQLRDSIQRREEEVGELREQLKQQNAKTAQLSRENQLLVLNNKALESKVQAASVEKESLEKSASIISEKVVKEGQVQLVIDELNSTISEFREKLQLREQEFDRMKSEIQQEKAQAEQFRIELNRKIEGLESEISGQQILNARLKKEIGIRFEEISYLNVRIETIEKQLLNSKQMLADCVNVILMSGERDLADLIDQYLIVDSNHDDGYSFNANSTINPINNLAPASGFYYDQNYY